eukprot:8651277-Pyramimonas_sp.AAC.1
MRRQWLRLFTTRSRLALLGWRPTVARGNFPTVADLAVCSLVSAAPASRSPHLPNCATSCLKRSVGGPLHALSATPAARRARGSMVGALAETTQSLTSVVWQAGSGGASGIQSFSFTVVGSCCVMGVPCGGGRAARA